VQWGSQPVSGGRRGLHVFYLVLAILVGFFTALLCLGFILEAAGYDSSGQTSSTAGDIVGALISLAIAAGCVLWAVHSEHMLRSHHPVAASFQAYYAPSAPAPSHGTGGPTDSPAYQSAPYQPYQPAPAYSSRAYRRRAFGGAPGRSFRRRGRYGPVSTTIMLLTLVGIFVGLIIGSVNLYGEGARSSDVQSNGLASAARVLTYQNHYHTSKSGGWYTSDVDVYLPAPVLGVDQTVVRDPHQFVGSEGDTVEVLIDRHNPRYAEFPGYPDTASYSWIITAVFAALCALMIGLWARAVVNMWRHRRVVLRSGS
jgi:hypothetical protein